MHKFLYPGLAATIFAFTACQSTSNDLTTDPVNDVLTYTIETVSATYKCADDTTKTCAKANVEFIDITTESPVAQSIEKYINQEVVGSTNAEVAPKTPQEMVNNFIAEFQQVEKESFNDQMPWETENTLKVELETPLFFEVSISSFSYTGGAHGNSFIRYVLFEKENGEKLGLDSLLVADAKESLVALGEAIFKKNEKLGTMSLEDAGFWFPENTFYLPENFLYTSDGLLFLYNPYEVAAYARGYIELLIPYNKAKELIKEKYRFITEAETEV